MATQPSSLANPASVPIGDCGHIHEPACPPVECVIGATITAEMYGQIKTALASSFNNGAQHILDQLVALQVAAKVVAEKPASEST